jgi:hypothetical protein
MSGYLDRHVPLLAVLFLVSTAAAQRPVPVAYPQESVTGTQANCAPLGQDFGSPYNGRCNEARAQILIPQAYLPSTGGVITGIEVAILAPQTPTVTYQVLDIDMGVTTAMPLSTTFATNLPRPVTVLSLRPPNSTITYTQGGWTPLNFTTPFPYGGTGNLVLEFRKLVLPGTSNTYMQVPSDPRRWDLPHQINIIGPGAMTALTANGAAMPLRMRLWFQNGRSLTVQNNASGPRNFEFTRGSTVTMTVHGQSGDMYGCFIECQGLGFVPPWSLPPLQGLCYLNPSGWLITVAQGVISSGNTDVRTFQVPNDPYFVGKKLAIQSLVGTLSGGLSWTPATDAIVNW